jgi:ATP phosphoribosyltransferase
VELGYLDAGITGLDLNSGVPQQGARSGRIPVQQVHRQPTRWVLAVPEEILIQSVKDLEGKRGRDRGRGVDQAVAEEKRREGRRGIFVGATEVKARELVDAIGGGHQTGSSLRANKLRIVETLLASTPRLIANHTAWQDSWKRQKIDDLRRCCSRGPSRPRRRWG